MNEEKTEYLLIGFRQRLNQLSGNPSIILGNHTIQQVPNKKVLGVIIDENLKWNEHNDAQWKQISKAIALLRRAQQFVTHEALLRMMAVAHTLKNYINYKSKPLE